MLAKALLVAFQSAPFAKTYHLSHQCLLIDRNLARVLIYFPLLLFDKANEPLSLAP